MNGALKALPAPDDADRKRRKLVAALRFLLILLPAVVMIALGWRTVAAASRGRLIGSRTLFQYVLRDRPTPGGGDIPPPRREGPGAWPRRSSGGLRVFAGADIPQEEVERSFRRRSIAFEWESRPERADLLLTGGRGLSQGAESEVMPDGRVTLRLPSAAPAVSEALAENVWGSVESLDGSLESLGLVAVYVAPDAPAVTERKELARRRPKPAPERRWAAIPLLVADTPQARLVPAIQVIRPGELCRVDFQVLGYDREWYSVTNRPETRFRVRTATEALMPDANRKGEFLAPIDARIQGSYERLVVEAVLEGPRGMGQSAEAVVIVDPSAGG